MSGRTAAALCLAAVLFSTASARWEWMTILWSPAAEEPGSPPVINPKGDEGWLIDPNG